MELKKHPETEMEYWKTIESLGGFIWRLEHDAGDGRIENTDNLEREICDGRRILETLTSELFELFGVVLPKDCPRTEFDKKIPDAPKGMVWYWDWYHGMKEKFLQSEYEKVICSACPFSKKVEYFCGNGGRDYPCKAHSGYMGILRDNICGMVAWKHWSEEYLFERISKKGKRALRCFQAKQTELRAGQANR